MDHPLEIGSTYFISFVDSLQPDYTHYSGEAVLLREISEDFDTNEQHYCFRIPEDKAIYPGDVECNFPKSSIHPSWNLVSMLKTVK